MPTADTVEAPARDKDLVKFVELLFFAYRDFTGDADELLDDLGYGRAHHRVIHFVARHPGLRVADLLDILRITKQSLARVLKQLIDEGFVTQQSGKSDRRERHLYLTQKGLNFADKLAQLQCARIGNAFQSMAPESKQTVEAFLFAMISNKDQAAVAALVEKKADSNEHEQSKGNPRDDQCDDADENSTS
jgi:DNA-binding MarR family transcriptional regulator